MHARALVFHVLSRLEINIECCSLVSVSLVYETGSLCGLELTVRLGLLVSELKEPPASASHCWNYKCALHLALYTEAGDRTGPHACWKALYRLSYLSPQTPDVNAPI